MSTELKFRMIDVCDSYELKNSCMMKIGKYSFNLLLGDIIQWEQEIKKAKEEIIKNYKKENEGQFY